MPVVTNVAGNRKLLAACLGVETAELADRFPRTLPEVHPLRVGEGRGLARHHDRGRRTRSDQAADPAAVHGRWRALHHRRPDLGARPGHRRRYHRLPPADAQGQEPPRPFAPFAPAHVRVSAPRRGARQVAARGHHDRDPSAALHGVDGLRLPSPCAEDGDHRRAVRRTVPRRALRRRRSRGPGGRRDRHRRRNPGRRRGNPKARSANSPATPPIAAPSMFSSPIACACGATPCSTA